MENNDSNLGIYDDCYNPYVFNEVAERSVCLDLGCWTGNLGEALIARKDCVVDGVDYRKDVLEKAKERGYRNVYEINLNNDTGLLKNLGSYDCIICADVLEHLADPKTTLSLLKEKLAKEGVVLISVPNIAFIQQRLLLTAGKFDYNPKGGIMDESHLRFFTKKSAVALLEDTGYRIQTAYGYALVKDRYFFLRKLAAIWPEMFALQLLLKAKNDKASV